MKARPPSPPGDPLAVEHLFRRHAGELVAILGRYFGPSRLDLVEDVVQEAFLAALRRWPFDGVPENPRAWIAAVARNRALDRLRRDGRWRERVPEVERSLRRRLEEDPADDVVFERELRDDVLRVVFACCHPALAREAQVALVLSAAGGFSAAEVARAFLQPTPTVAQRLVRARRRLRELGDDELVVEGKGRIGERLDAVLEGLYLLFNEGYASYQGEDPIRVELCSEALRLVELLAEHPMTRAPRVDALAALFCFQAARLPARADASGELMLLDEQDRSLWDRALLRRGLEHFRRSARGELESAYHLQAEIASCHSLAPSPEDTDWKRILDRYDRLEARWPSPVVRLNRAVALSRARGAEEALDSLEELAGSAALERYYPFFVVRAHLRTQVGDGDAAREDLETALELAGSEPVRRLVERRLGELNPPSSAS